MSDVHVATTSVTVDVSITSRPSVHHYYKRYCRLANVEGVGMRGWGMSRRKCPTVTGSREQEANASLDT